MTPKEHKELDQIVGLWRTRAGEQRRARTRYRRNGDERSAEFCEGSRETHEVCANMLAEYLHSHERQT